MAIPAMHSLGKCKFAPGKFVAPGRFDGGSAFISVHQSHQVNCAFFSNNFYPGCVEFRYLGKRCFYFTGNQRVIGAEIKRAGYGNGQLIVYQFYIGNDANDVDNPVAKFFLGRLAGHQHIGMPRISSSIASSAKMASRVRRHLIMTARLFPLRQP